MPDRRFVTITFPTNRGLKEPVLICDMEYLGSYNP